MQTVTAGGPGSTLSLCFCVEKFHFYSQERKILARYLFNAGDNLPRVAQENKVMQNRVHGCLSRCMVNCFPAFRLWRMRVR